MNDKELADRIVALGVGSTRFKNSTDKTRYRVPNTHDHYSEYVFVRDWRVAGALMEKCSHIDAYWDDTGWSCEVVGTFKDRGIGKHGIGKHDGMVARTELPRAICEACVAALVAALEAGLVAALEAALEAVPEDGDE